MNLLIMTYEPAPGTSLYPERSACGSPDQSAVSDLPIYITGYLTHEGPRHETGVAAAAVRASPVVGAPGCRGGRCPEEFEPENARPLAHT